MNLTPLDIQDKVFSSALFGYNKAEVREFLEEVAETLKELQKENNTFKDEVVRLKRELSRYQEEERAIRDAIVKAQSLAETLKEEAVKEAENILTQARNEAEALRQKAEEERLQVQNDIEKLRQERERLFLEIKAILTSWQEHLEKALKPA